MRFLKTVFYIIVLAAIFVIGMRLAFPLPDTNYAEAAYKSDPDWEGPLGRAIAVVQERNPDLDGIRPLGNGRAAFAARAVLARQATSSIDAQYYIWQDDVTGLMLLDELRAAAKRGVRVRLLVDDNGIPGLDDLMAELDALPTASVRIFNPFTLRSPKLLSYTFDFGRLNRRMHNKSMTVDGVATVIGGRNIGDIYFDYGAGTHYLDVDTIAIGPVVGEVADAFDAYWNSGSAYDANLVLDPFTGQAIASLAEAARKSALGGGYQEAIEESELEVSIVEQTLRFEWSEVTLYVDDPAKGLGAVPEEDLVLTGLIDIAQDAKTSLDIVSAYFIPQEGGADLLTGLSEAGVKVRTLTNSLDATDVMPVHAAYMAYREELLESGVEMLELRALRDKHKNLSLPEMLAGSASGLHAKVFGVDGKRIFIGSFNLDPRSARLNTEMGMLIESPTITVTLAEQLNNANFAYRLSIGEDGGLIWTEENKDGEVVTYTKEPQSSWFQRAMTSVVRILPVEWML